VINFGLGAQKRLDRRLILTYMFALMGIQCSPAFTMWTFGIKSPKPLAWQQAFMSTFVVGFALFFFTAFPGIGGAKFCNCRARLLPNCQRATVVPL
jgi:SSS family solute:Na+ symporter